MPWEKSFDVDDAVDRATEVFWAKGYEATSMADLVDGMGINKGSLYNAFGSKKALFKLALTKYEAETRDSFLTPFESIEDPVLAISSFFDSMIAQSVTDTSLKGCFMVNTVLNYPNHSEDVQDILQMFREGLEGFFTRLIQRGQEQGTISDAIVAKDTAKALLAMMVGVRVLSRGLFDVSSLAPVKKEAMRLITS